MKFVFKKGSSRLDIGAKMNTLEAIIEGNISRQMYSKKEKRWVNKTQKKIVVEVKICVS